MTSFLELNKEKLLFFQDNILRWYNVYGRSFPWRNRSTSKYEYIIAEVLLQRTKAETVAKFYPIFIKKYPSWQQLGNASKQKLIEEIKPIGLHNQRGARLYQLAQEMKHRNGRYPSNRNEVEDIPMIGQYIANAYELFILKKTAPLLDVNMARLLERFFGPRTKADIRYDKYLQNLARDVVNCNERLKINWGILDFASSECRKKNPKCTSCILRVKCLYFNNLKITK